VTEPTRLRRAGERLDASDAFNGGRPPREVVAQLGIDVDTRELAGYAANVMAWLAAQPPPTDASAAVRHLDLFLAAFALGVLYEREGE
jgi:hypothetical protein